MLLYVFVFLIYTDLIINQEIRTRTRTRTHTHTHIRYHNNLSANQPLLHLICRSRSCRILYNRRRVFA